jgi:hypothetical protein
MTKIGTAFDGRWSLSLDDLYVGRHIQVDDGFQDLEPFGIYPVREADGRYYINRKDGAPFFLDDYAVECTGGDPECPPSTLHCMVEPIDVLKPMLAQALAPHDHYNDASRQLEKLSPDFLETLGKALDVHRKAREAATGVTAQAQA